MGSVRRLQYTDRKTGKKKKTAKYYAVYTSHDGRQQRVPAFTDRASSLQLLAKLEREAAEIRAGLRHPGSGDASRPLAELLAEFAAHKEAQGRSCGHLTNIRVNVAAVIAGCGWSVFPDVTADSLTRWAAGRLAGDDGVSPATVNAFLAPTKTFARWLAKRCGMAHPLADFPLLNPDVDLRRNGYTPTPADVAAVVAAAERTPRRRAVLSGPDRAMLYRVACYSGFRASELASLTPESFTWAGGVPASVTIQAAFAKDRKTATVPIPSLGAVLGPWLAARPAGEWCWPGAWAAERRQSSWLRRDCERAGVRRFTFHGFRRFLADEAVRARVTITELRRLMRHKSAVITLRYYARATDTDLAAAASRLPPLPLG